MTTLFDKELADALKAERLRRARPWAPLSADYLKTAELLSLIGMQTNEAQYRRALRYLRMASNRSDATDHVPDSLRSCFRESVRVHAFKGNGGVEVEYRIPIESLSEEYAARARKLVAARNVDLGPSICVSQGTYRKLKVLSLKKKKTIPEMLEAWAHQELQRSLEHGGLASGEQEACFCDA